MKHLLFSECCRFLICRKVYMDLYFLSTHCLIGTLNLTCSQMWLLILTPPLPLTTCYFSIFFVSVNSIQPVTQTLSLGGYLLFPSISLSSPSISKEQQGCVLFLQTRSPILLTVFLLLTLVPKLIYILQDDQRIFKNRKQLLSVSCLLHCKNLTLPNSTRPPMSHPVYFSAIIFYNSTLNRHMLTYWLPFCFPNVLRLLVLGILHKGNAHRILHTEMTEYLLQEYVYVCWSIFCMDKPSVITLLKESFPSSNH